MEEIETQPHPNPLYPPSHSYSTVSIVSQMIPSLAEIVTAAKTKKMHDVESFQLLRWKDWIILGYPDLVNATSS
ncbi:unnamed protein product [Sphenostylis stenocarpa]|uniref:Uncharacterized protein n=1 Tax=Sphenostylis stenocarpa TaxID=92480 RepID=A0AA86VLL5_9FABA|nr:unnamed protein product [Sphenostylis stenocarpa]